MVYKEDNLAETLWTKTDKNVEKIYFKGNVMSLTANVRTIQKKNFF